MIQIPIDPHKNTTDELKKKLGNFIDDTDTDEDYEVTQKADWGQIVTKQCLIIGELAAREGHNNPEKLLTAVNILQAYVAKDTMRSPKFLDSMQELNEWKNKKLMDLPPKQKALREFSLKYEYAMRKFQNIITLMDDRGYFGSKILR